MEIRDPVHGSIKIKPEEVDIIEHPFFQRLRNIKQLGFSEYIFPGATHTRYLHSIGVMEVSTRVLDQLFKDKIGSEYEKLKETLRMACLLHDVGHAPLSHTTEFVMPMVSKLNLPPAFAPAKDHKATHEDYTIKSIVDSSFTKSFTKVTKSFGVIPEKVAELIIGESKDRRYFTVDGVDYFPMLHQLVSSEMDCDRMDYLLRDSYFCGVSYGKFDLDWIIDNLGIAITEGEAYLGINERAIATFDDFLLCRFHMFLMVYFHYKAVCLEKVLERYFNSEENEYTIPADIEAYLEHDDHFLMKVLRKSKNKWAQKVIRNSIPSKIFESFGPDQNSTLNQLISYLESEGIDYIKCSSSGRLSKYYTETNDVNKYPIKVIRTSSLLPDNYSLMNIDQATDLFEKFSKSHAVSRIHCELKDLSSKQLERIKDIVKS